jgi:hypothetical protein
LGSGHLGRDDTEGTSSDQGGNVMPAEPAVRYEWDDDMFAFENDAYRDVEEGDDGVRD